jgi:uncharacterized LabA/DUF88 family protein
VSNYAFIDGQNIFQGFQRIGWQPDWRRFRVHLKESYDVGRALYFIGYMAEHRGLYGHLTRCGYDLVYKEVVKIEGKPKGNVDAELVLHSMIEYPNYTGAVIIAGDGDYACLVRYLKERGKLGRVLSPHRDQCSGPLKKAAEDKMDFLEDLQQKIGRKN